MIHSTNYKTFGFLKVVWTTWNNEGIYILNLGTEIELLISLLKHMFQWDGSFEHEKHMLKLTGKKTFIILPSNSLPIFIKNT